VNTETVSKNTPRPQPHDRGECDWCRRELGDVVEQWNGGVGHEECVGRVYEIVVGPDPVIPWAKPRRLYRESGAAAFFNRLGIAAVLEGIDRQALARAIARATR
jgi:hypothetical protein